ncbi:MAG: DUF2309 domain-containing protein [Spirochaetaceae bacterium]|nr:DUF2309 domain-containing protein [Spirochaetaceae bacterium]
MTRAPAGLTSPAQARAILRADVTVAARIVAPLWPVETFIAVNPLGGLESVPFATALQVAGDVLGARGTCEEPTFRAMHRAGRIKDADLHQALARRLPVGLLSSVVRLGALRLTAMELLLADLVHGDPSPQRVRSAVTLSQRTDLPMAALVDAQTSKWCAAYIGADHIGWPMPGREAGLYRAWAQLAPLDRSLPRRVRRDLAGLPTRADDAALAALDRLGVEPAERQRYLRAHLAAQPGWAGHLRWRAEHHGDVDLTDYLAVRLSYEAALLNVGPGARRPRPAPTATPTTIAVSRATPEQPEEVARVQRLVEVLKAGPATTGQVAAGAEVLAQLPAAARTLVWLDAFEGHYRDRLLHLLTAAEAGLAPTEIGLRPSAQLVCCIDARSEGLRRHLEATGPYETFGFAGFFAAAIAYQDLAGGRPDVSCPVLVAPANRVEERAAPGTGAAAARRLAGLAAVAGAEAGFHEAKDDTLGPFALAEAAGWLAGPWAAAKTAFPAVAGRWRRAGHRLLAPTAPTTVSIEEGFTLDERVLLAQVALTMMGLTRGFARLVAFCGHGSTTSNNPYQAALDCGACGGHRGGPNARTAAAILNEPQVRTALAERGISVPHDTWFLAAEHDTATDRVTVLDGHQVPPSHQPDLHALTTNLAKAGRALAAERCTDLPGASAARPGRAAAREAVRRSGDWAQVYPEWGLAGNAAFIIGPRAMTAPLDLDRRVFLHSYDPAIDPGGTALETILTAPMVVAQWINAQYYFSTVDPVTFGAGTKTIHNPIGGIGVLAGPGGDLQTGLPRQSVAVGDRPFHEPMRLLTAIRAPRHRIDQIIDQNPALRHLFDHGWVTLAASEHPADPWQRRTPTGWQPWTPDGLPDSRAARRTLAQSPHPRPISGADFR